MEQHADPLAGGHAGVVRRCGVVYCKIDPGGHVQAVPRHWIDASPHLVATCQ